MEIDKEFKVSRIEEIRTLVNLPPTDENAKTNEKFVEMVRYSRVRRAEEMYITMMNK